MILVIELVFIKIDIYKKYFMNLKLECIAGKTEDSRLLK